MPCIQINPVKPLCPPRFAIECLLTPLTLSTCISSRPRCKMANEMKKVFDEFNVKLVQHLPLKDAFFLAELTRQNLFSGNLKEAVMTAPTQKDATTCFLDEAIKPSLDVGNREAFDKLLLVMQKSDYRMVNKLAEKIKQKLSSIPEIKTSTSG